MYGRILIRAQHRCVDVLRLLTAAGRRAHVVGLALFPIPDLGPAPAGLFAGMALPVSAPGAGPAPPQRLASANIYRCPGGANGTAVTFWPGAAIFAAWVSRSYAS